MYFIININLQGKIYEFTTEDMLSEKIDDLVYRHGFDLRTGKHTIQGGVVKMTMFCACSQSGTHNKKKTPISET